MPTQFQLECRAAMSDVGFARGRCVEVKKTGERGVVRTKLIRGPGKVRQVVKFDDGLCRTFDARELVYAEPDAASHPSEVDLLGKRIRRT